MASQDDVKVAARDLRNALYQAADSGAFPAETNILFTLHLSVSAALRAFQASPGSAAAYPIAVTQCQQATQAVGALVANDQASLRNLVREVGEAVAALEAATGAGLQVVRTRRRSR
jgi:hypothetical protein